MLPFSTKFLTVTSLLALTAISRADLSYTQTTISAMGVMPPAGQVTRTLIKGEVTRSEAMLLGKPLILLMKPSGELTQIDPESKTYTMGMPGQKGSTQSAYSDFSVSAKRLGDQTLRGKKVPHWMVKCNTVITRGELSFPTNLDFEIWSSNTPYPTVAVKPGRKTVPLGIRAMLMGNATVSGDVVGAAKAYAYVPLRTKLTSNGATVSFTETSDISTETLSPDLFKVPADYKKISLADWDKRMVERLNELSLPRAQGGAPAKQPKMEAPEPQTT